MEMQLEIRKLETKSTLTEYHKTRFDSNPVSFKADSKQTPLLMLTNQNNALCMVLTNQNKVLCIKIMQSSENSCKKVV